MKDSFFASVLKHKISIFMIVLLLAFVGYRMSPTISQGVFPNVFFPRVNVTIENGYAPVNQMLFQITRPVEESLKTVQGVERVTSATSVGSTDINLYFSWSMNPYLAYQLVQARLAEQKNTLPSDAKITVIQATPSRYPVAMYAIGSDNVPPGRLTEVLYYNIRPLLLSVNGIQDVEIIAPQWQEYKIVLDAEKMKNYGLSVDLILTLLKEQDNIQFLGIIRDYRQQYVLSLNQKPTSVNNISELKIPLSGGNYVSLSDIALIVEDTAPPIKVTSASGFKNAVVFNILRQPDANSINTMSEIDQKLKQFNHNMKGSGMEVRKYYDETEFINAAIKSVRDAIILGTLIASLIVFLFLKKFKISISVLLTVPVVFFITIIGIKLLRFDFNIFSLGGMAAATGGLIDQLIIVIESIEKRYRESKDKMVAVMEGSKEILPAMTVATLVSTLIFMPLLMVSGVVGTFFKQLAFVLIFTYVISQILAIFLTPIIVYSSLPAVPVEEKPDRLDRFLDWYIPFLGSLRRFSWISVPIMLSGFCLCFLLYKNLPSTFLPKWDEGNFVVDIALRHGTSLKDSFNEFLEISKLIDSTPEVRNWTLRVGASLGHASEQANVGDFLVTLRKERKRSVYEIKEEVKDKIAGKFTNLEELDTPMILEDRLGDILGVEAPISVILYGPDPDKLISWGEKVRDTLRKSGELDEINLKTSYASPSIEVRLKPDAETLYGINTSNLINQLNAMYWGSVVGNVIKGEKIIGLRVMLGHSSEDPISYVKNNLLIYSPVTGVNIPLSYAADLKFKKNIPEISHYNLSPVSVTTVRFKGNDMSYAVKTVKSALAGMNIPPDIAPEVSGFYKEQQRSFSELTFVIIFSIIIIFICLILQFERIPIALIILGCLFLTLSGVFFALLITGRPLDITSFMGMLIVLSIVINNNILIFHFYKKYRELGYNRKESILSSVKLRFRPILMTMVSNVFALLPIALALGAGTQIIQNIGIAVMGGLILAIFVNLFVLPLLMMI
ncbi:MAG: efflux RND transporter permease subunit [Firmicutes bacterium]|nr:efflux RND transporter permease subunit [Bacillota bacterium]